MISPSSSPLFLFILVNSSGQSYTLDASGSVRPIGRPTPLTYSPDGWIDSALGYERNLQKFGLVRSFMISLGFFGDGAQILKYLMYNRNVDERVWLVVLKREVEVTATDFYISYPMYYKGELDMSTAKQAGPKVTVSIMEGGRTKDLAANTATLYEIPVDKDPEAVRVRMPGLELHNTFYYAIPEGAQSNLDAAPITFIRQESGAPLVEYASQDPSGTASSQWFFRYVGNTTLDINGNVLPTPPLSTVFVGKILFKVDPTGHPVQDVHVKLLIINNGATVATAQGNDFLGVVAGSTYEVDYLNAIPLNKGDQLFLQVQAIPTAGGDPTMRPRLIFSYTAFSIAYSSAFPASFIKVLPPFVAFKRFVNRMCGSPFYATSQLLQASTFCVTSGDAIRGLAGAAIKSSFDQFFNSFSKRLCAGLGIEGTQLVLEGRDYFLNDANFYDLGEVKNIEISPYTAVLCNTVEAGYQNQTYDNLNGRYEFNALSTFILPGAQRVPKKFDLKLDYRADYYGAEFCRINLQGKTTVDAASDNDTWLLDVDLATPKTDALGTYYELRHLPYSSISGVPDPAVGNIELSPKRVLLAWADWFRSVFYGYEGQALQFENSSKNEALSTTLAGQTINEFDGLAITPGGRLLFLPFQISVSGVAGNEVVKILQQNPATCFLFSYKGIALKGFLLKGSVKPKTREQQQFVFLSHPDNNLKQFINAE